MKGLVIALLAIATATALPTPTPQLRKTKTAGPDEAPPAAEEKSWVMRLSCMANFSGNVAPACANLNPNQAPRRLPPQAATRYEVKT
ncbi:hypothetical protein L249_3736 [Ophiocordyceps polyrhachis-furcata BCC 54312]|uniref:Uncharacterized protein n=1 Tax=Ophiocordyceps polyrhachis-furcata BCC 54312 TaxID=1330021 RepID=A0A367L4V9_9HYPO|nr:hypothetical protein L249_3736 [Ophiocordyceps polyrhachis-furcata BCC 54312]